MAPEIKDKIPVLPACHQTLPATLRWACQQFRLGRIKELSIFILYYALELGILCFGSGFGNQSRALISLNEYHYLTLF